MKRVVCLIVAVLLCTAMAIPAFATMDVEVDFVPSITAKPAPGMSTSGTDDTSGDPVIEVFDPDEEVVNACPLDHLLITPISAVMNDNGELAISPEAIETLKHAYEQMNHPEMNILEAVPELEDELLAAGVYLDAMETVVVTAIFDVTIMCEEMGDYLSVDGNYVELTFDADIPEGYKAIVLVYKNDEWQTIKSVVDNGDGTITCSFEHFCPVVIMTVPTTSIDESVANGTSSEAAPAAPEAAAPVAAATVESASGSYTWLIAVVVVAVAGVVVISKKKGSKDTAESK